MTLRIGRNLTIALLLATLVIASLSAQSPAEKPRAATENTEATSTASKVFSGDQMPSHKSQNGTETRAIPGFALTTGESVGFHESLQPSGAPPVPLHVIQHSELIIVQEGSMLFEHDGKQEKAGPGDIVYVAKGTMHRLINVGNTPARYAVVQIGGDVKH
ncbi:MAG TPA: cupin domain-containing protein [Edaphobacter sp.]|jgi:mannose-6-phosphate isomerase-like protein (cupin superfamily)|nr:cupin domain-containing protein [Edaphobacter sp.]